MEVRVKSILIVEFELVEIYTFKKLAEKGLVETRRRIGISPIVV